MRLVELHLKAFGPFTNQVLRLGSGTQHLVLVHGLNEAGKSTALRAISALRFGIPPRSADKFVHDYQHMRVGGVFVDAEGNRYSLMRRKGTGVTLKFADFANGGEELPDAVPSSVVGLLTAGLSVEDYESMFGLDFSALRAGGSALARGEGEIGAALFEASSGIGDVSKILDELDAAARKFFIPAGKMGRINVALSEHKAKSDQHKAALVRPSKWESIYKASLEARETLGLLQAEHDEHLRQHLLIKELIAVAPTLDALAHANQVLEELAQVTLLAEDAPSERAKAEAGLSEAQADAMTNASEVDNARALVDSFTLDPNIIAVGQSVTRLHAAAASISALRSNIATAKSDISSRALALKELAARIDPTVESQELVRRAPTAPHKAEINACIAALDEAERALTQHRQAAPAPQADEAQRDARVVPDSPLQAAVRVALLEVTKNEATLKRLTQLPSEIGAAERTANASLAGLRLPDEPSARQVKPLLGASIDEASRELTELASRRSDKAERADEIAQAIAQQQDEIDALLAHGHVPTHEEVSRAREHRQHGWAFVRATYIERTAVPDAANFTQGQPLPEAYEQAVAAADGVVDELARDTGRVSSLEAARRKLSELDRDLKLRSGEIQVIDQQKVEIDGAWAQTLTAASIPLMPPAELRDWQARLERCLSQLDTLQSKRDELEQAQALDRALADKLRQAIERLGLMSLAGGESLGTLVAIAEDALKQIDALKEARSTAAGRAQQFEQQVTRHNSREIVLGGAVGKARAAFAEHLPALLLGRDATVAMAKARVEEFDGLLKAHEFVLEAEARQSAHGRALELHQETANSIAAALSEHAPSDITLAADLWAGRLERAQEQQRGLGLAKQSLANAEKVLFDDRAKIARHKAALERLRVTAGVEGASQLPEAEELSRRKRQAMRDASGATDALAKASRRTVEEMRRLLAGREHDTLLAEDARIEHEQSEVGDRLAKARAAEEAARRELESIDSSDAAAVAADAMARAAATVRHALPLHVRNRLAHALLQEAVRRFKDKSQAPMLRAASRYFGTITGGEFESLFSDDSNATPVIAARRPGGATVSVEGMSEGTRDQMYLALRLAALDLQRERGVQLPVVLDDVLMTSDDVRAGHILKALAEFSASGQVIVFTHHQHLVEVARRNVDSEALAVVELMRA